MVNLREEKEFGNFFEGYEIELYDCFDDLNDYFEKLKDLINNKMCKGYYSIEEIKMITVNTILDDLSNKQKQNDGKNIKKGNQFKGGTSGNSSEEVENDKDKRQ